MIVGVKLSRRFRQDGVSREKITEELHDKKISAKHVVKSSNLRFGCNVWIRSSTDD